MGRDKILGLSLAILLIGFAGAFCFRNEPLVENGLKLAREKFLDNTIAERPAPKPESDVRRRSTKTPLPTVTLQGIESLEPAAQDATVQTDSGLPAAVLQSPTTDSDIESQPSASPADRFASDRRSLESDDKIGETRRVPEVLIRPRAPLADESEYWSNDRDTDWQTNRGAKNETTSAGIRQPPKRVVHRVRRGDTLTKIAQLYLGDRRRYLEIFDANRDQMEKPDDRLRVGMTLKIPPIAAKNSSNGMSRSAETQSPAMHNVSRVRQSPPSLPSDMRSSVSPRDEEARPSVKARFVPVSKAPFLRREAETPANSESGSPDQPAERSLSQTLPETLPADNLQSDNP